MAVRLYEDADFAGKQQPFGAGTYRADKGQLGALSNDSISSARVPFGWTVDLFEHENQGHGGGMKLVLPFGDHRYVGNPFNDIASLVKVYPFTDVYLSTDDPRVPAALSFEIHFTSTTDGKDQSVGVKIGYDTDTRYYKELRYRLPDGATPNVWEATKNGSAGWTHSVDGDELLIRVWVTPRDTFGARNWVGVRVSV